MRLGVIGCGRIAQGVIRAVLANETGRWKITSVLVRDGDRQRPFEVQFTNDVSHFLATKPDLVVEMAGPMALRTHAIPVLKAVDMWSISGMALADQTFVDMITQTGRESGHRLRLLPGAVAGLDGLSMIAVDPNASIAIAVSTTAGSQGAAPQFTGRARDVLQQFGGVNVVAAAALASAGLDTTIVDYFPPVAGARRRFEISAESRYGSFTAITSPITTEEEGTLSVSASVIAALRKAQATIWAG